MSIILRKEIARFLIIAFIFFLIPSDSFPVKRDERAGIKLINEAENLFRNYKYDESIEKFNKAKKYIKQEINLSRLYLGLSRSYYAMGLMVKVKEEIRLLALLTIKEPFNEDEYPRGFIKVYKGNLADIAKKKREKIIVKTEDEPESLYQVEKQGEETKEITKKTFAGVIEKPGKKKKKKKSLILPITLGAVALGAVVMLMGKKSGDDIGSDTASVHIESYPSDADVYVDGVSKNVRTPCNITVPVEEETEIKLVIDGWGETAKNQRYSKGNSYTLNAQLAPYKYVSEQNITMFPETNPNSWDCDSEGNLYAVSQSGNVFIDKYDQPVMGYSSTIELDRTFDLSKAWFFIEQDISRF
ncbi:MAG: PEGA domain-containing protein, partial [Candidatus Aminicenantes bacterium]|nr:PEGA domain-containing protein [Candidatus Aminicenantes bacterium]